MPSFTAPFLLASIALSVSSAAKATNLFSGTGSATHDARSVACQQAERKARIDAARQAESFVHQVVRTTLVENQHGLQQARDEFIEQTVYGLAQLQGSAQEDVRITQDQQIECRVHARYRFDSDAIRQHYLAEQARQAREAGHHRSLANLQQEWADNQRAYQALQQHIPPSRHGSGSFTTFCAASASASQCETLIKEVIAQPYLQQLNTELGIDHRLLQASLQLQGRTEITALNSQLNQLDWQGDYQLAIRLSDPYATRNQQIQRELRQLSGQAFRPEQTFSAPGMASSSPAVPRFAVTFGSDCMLGCSDSVLEPANTANAGSVRGNFVQTRFAAASWLQLNAGIYHEHYRLCLEEATGRSSSCNNAQSARAWYPALGVTVRQQWVYLEAMHLFSIRDTDMVATTLDKGYQRFELGLSTRQDRQGLTGAIGMSSRLMPASSARWDGWDIVFRLGYVF